MFSRLFVRSLIPAFVFLALAGFFFPAHVYGASDELLHLEDSVKKLGLSLSVIIFFYSIVLFVSGRNFLSLMLFLRMEVSWVVADYVKIL